MIRDHYCHYSGFCVFQPIVIHQSTCIAMKRIYIVINAEINLTIKDNRWYITKNSNSINTIKRRELSIISFGKAFEIIKL